MKTLLWLFLLIASNAVAQAYPARPITLVVPYTPGTGIDIVARTVGPKISERWGQPVVVENKPGASGNIGAAIVAKAQPDGYTLMVNVNTFTVTPVLYSPVPYDPVKDFTHITRATNGNLALVTSSSALPVKTVDELTAAARSRKLSYSSPGNGTPHHLGMELLKQRLKIDILHVPYKGSAQALTDLLGGQVQLAVFPVHVALPHVKAGRLDLYFFLSGPARLPRDIVQKWNRELVSILVLPGVRDTFLKQGMVPAHGSPEEISKQISADAGRWKKFIAETGIKPD